MRYKNPIPTVDIIIEQEGGVLVIQRKNPPLGWAFPGGFVDEGESLERAAVREAKEETGLKVSLYGQLGSYSDPQRDQRKHTISTVFVAAAQGEPRAMDDAAAIRKISAEEVLEWKFVFDHEKIFQDYISWKKDPFPLFLRSELKGIRK